MKTIKGPALFLAQFAGDAAPFNSWDVDHPVGRRVRLRRRSDPDLGRAAVRPRRRPRRRRTIATSSRASRAANGVEVTELSTHLQGQLVAVHPAYDEPFDGFAAPEVRGQSRRRGRHGRWSRCEMALQASRQHGPERDGDLLRRARLALRLSLAAAAGGADRDRLRRAGPALAADPRPRRGERASTSATRSIPARTCSTARPSRCSSTGSTGTRAPTCSTTRRTTCCSASTISTTSTSTTSGSGCSTSRTPSSIRPAGRGSIPAISGWVERAGRFRSPGDGQVDFGAVFSKLAAHDFDGWAVVEWECALKHPEDGAREGAEFVRAAHHPRDREGLRRLRRRRHRRGGEPPDARAAAGTTGRMEDDGTETAAHPARHGRRRQGRLHRRGAPDRRADRRPVRTGRRRAARRRRRSARESGAALGLAEDRDLRRLRDDGQARGAAEERHRGGGDRHPEPHARPGGQGIPEARHPCHLRQAADRDAGRGEEAGQGRGENPGRSSS